MDTVNQAVNQAAQTVHASTPASGSGTPLMSLASYLLYAECALIILLSLPIYVPGRKQLLEWVHYSPRLWTLRVVIVCIHAFVAILLGDTYLRLNRVTHQIETIQATHAHAAAGTLPNPQVAVGGLAGGMQAESHAGVQSLNDLFSQRFRGQRDFYILAFTLFCSTVLFQLHLLLIKMDRFRFQRDELRQKLSGREKKETSSVSQRASELGSGVTRSLAEAKDAISEKVSNLIHPSVHGTVEVEEVQLAPAAAGTNAGDAVVQQRRAFVPSE